MFRKKTNTFESKSRTANNSYSTKTISFDRNLQTKNVHFHQQNSPTLTIVLLQNSYFLLILHFFIGKMHFSETRKDVIGKKLLGSNRPYMSYPMKFTFYLHGAYGY